MTINRKDETTKDYFTIVELSEYSRVGTKFLYQAVKNQALKHIKVGKKVIVSRRDFEAWFNTQSKNGE